MPTPGETPELKARVAAEVVALRHLAPRGRLPSPTEKPGETAYKRAEADIEFPLEAIGTDLAALTTIAIGGVYSIKGFSGIRIVGMKPAAGVRGRASRSSIRRCRQSRALRGCTGRPIIGSIVKPALGLRPNETAELVREFVEADVDFIKDDEKLMSPAYSPLAERVKAIMPVILDREQKTGKKVMYAFGISHADPETMVRSHDSSPMRAATPPSSTSTRSVTAALPICASARASRCMRIAMVGTSSPAILALGWISLSINNSGACWESISFRSMASRRNTGSRTIFRVLVRGDQDAAVLGG